MLKWVVTRGPNGVGTSLSATNALRVPPINIPAATPDTCSCNKENHCQEFIEIENNNSFAFNDLGNYYSPRKCRLSSGPVKRSATHGQCQCSRATRSDREPLDLSCAAKRLNFSSSKENCSTPLTSRISTQGRTKKLRTRRERNKTLSKRLSSVHFGQQTPNSPAVGNKMHPSSIMDLYQNPVSVDLLQSFLNSNQMFNEREVKTPPEENENSPSGCGQLYRQRAIRYRKQPGRTELQKVSTANSYFNSYVFR
ncbi:uncharacterized protein LOC129745564 [Uranotaenia lowii]|uniref:uncharacterized protein LOC129745564 n=1 Tax=Uranotaenia lowii TaxID=190385 RepID=UPI00247893EF|nr:uncharacterized protein LOC129745564 [Uranotaenia lowii]